MASRGDAGLDDVSKKRKQQSEVSEGAGGEEVVSVKLENGEVVALSIAKERAENFRDLRQAQRVRFAKFFKQLTDDLQCGKELPADHELYQYLASTELARLRELASLLAKDKSKPPPPPPRVSKPEFEQAVAMLAAAHPCHVRNWPKDALYTGRLLNEYDVRNYALQPNTWPAQPTLETFVEIRPLASETHPAFPGLGVFAAHPIPANAEIGLYTGILRKRPKTNDSESLYIAALTRETDIDAEQVGNEVRFINDFRNTGKEPNVKYERAQRGPRLVLIVRTTRFVAQDEELLVDYGDEYWRQLHKNRRRRAVREANQYSDSESEESSEVETPVRKPTRVSHSSSTSSHHANGGTANEDSGAALRAWQVALEEMPQRGNRAIEWLVKEELAEVLATGRKRFSVPGALIEEAEVFTKLNWQRFDRTSWRIPDEIDVQALGRTYDDYQKVQTRARAQRAGSLYASSSGGLQPPRKQAKQPHGDEGASMVSGYPELLGMLQLRELKENGTISAEEFMLYKTHLTKAFVGRFGSS